jgi:hypothetical protein
VGHIIPSFIFSWIKETSTTGYLRNPENINMRIQDGVKKKLLCHDCEQLFSTWEKKFSENIFAPYVQKELNISGIPSGIMKSIKYEEWLLRFIISVQWRILIDDDGKIECKDDEYIQKEIKQYKTIFKDYLLNRRPDTGKNQTHLMFLQSLTSVKGNLPKDVPDNIDSYLLRTSDATILMKNRKWGIYSKFGPIIAFTAMENWQLKNMIGTRIKLRGEIPIVQSILDHDIGNYITIKRPNDANSMIKFSKKQNEILKKPFDSDDYKNSETMSKAVIQGREIIRKKKSD